MEELTAWAPDGAIVGLVGEDRAAIGQVLRWAGGVETPEEGELRADQPQHWQGMGQELERGVARTLALDHTLAAMGAFERGRARVELERLRRQGTTVLVATAEHELARTLCDEVWWLDQGRLRAKGDPREVLEQYQRETALRLAAWGGGQEQHLHPAMRRGDGRAEIVGLETLDGVGKPTSVWRSGEVAAVAVRVRFQEEVADPVVGIMIRTRVGFEVFGTNTDLERVRLGPVAAGEVLRVVFRFRCDLCAQEYTLTAASHDPDGVWHDWMEDALALTVADDRYTAGVANLRASVMVEREG